MGSDKRFAENVRSRTLRLNERFENSYKKRNRDKNKKTFRPAPVSGRSAGSSSGGTSSVTLPEAWALQLVDKNVEKGGFTLLPVSTTPSDALPTDTATWLSSSHSVGCPLPTCVGSVAL